MLRPESLLGNKQMSDPAPRSCRGYGPGQAQVEGEGRALPGEKGAGSAARVGRGCRLLGGTGGYWGRARPHREKEGL